jgi:hypothetical protein
MTESTMRKMIQSKNPDKEYPSNLGNKWTILEEQQLLLSIEKGLDIETISKQHNRSLGGIQSRIQNIAYEMFLQQISMEIIMKRTRLTLLEINTIISHKQTEKTCKKTSKKENGKGSLQNVDQDGRASCVPTGSLGLLCPGQAMLAEDTDNIVEKNNITLENVHQEVQTMKHEMKGLKNNIKELIELIQAIYEFSEE